jgi:23S rRNA pseudouridine2605 synthase
MPNPVPLERALSKLGMASRKEAVRLIAEGHVQVNGRVVRDAMRPVRLATDLLSVRGMALVAAAPRTLMMNKPRGVVTTRKDEAGRKTVHDLLPADCGLLSAVGRLDKASAGLLLFTNDHQLGERLTNPRSHVRKRYRVKVRGHVDERVLAALRAGVVDPELGRLTAVAVDLERQTEKGAWLHITLDEGKNRQIRRMAEALRLEVQELIRTDLGPLQLGDLAPGAVRDLSAEELRMLRRAAGV